MEVANTSKRKAIGHVVSRMKRLRKRCPSCRASVITCFAFSYLYAYLFLASNSDIDISMESKVESKVYKDVHFNNETVSLYTMHLEEIRNKAFQIARVYQPSHPSTWCIDGRLKLDQKKGQPMGLCYLKIPHAAGTTLKSINMRISRNFAERYGSENCIRHDSNSLGMQYSRRDEKSFLWTFLRDPTDRALSAIGSKLSNDVLGSNSRYSFFNASLSPDADTDNDSLTQSNNQILVDKTLKMLRDSKDIHTGILSEGRGGFQLQYCMQTMIPVNSVIDPWRPTEIINLPFLVGHVSKMFEKYNFIGLVERFDESLVVMQLLLGLESSDILYFAVNRKEDFRLTSRKKKVCRKTFDWETDLVTEPAIRDYVTGSEQWHMQNYGDYLLYQAAAQSLDQTILEIGLDSFSRELKIFRSLLERAEEECSPKFACSSNGTQQFDEAEYDCLADGTFGCGHRCLDSITA